MEQQPDPHTPFPPDEPAKPHESAAEPGAEHSSTSSPMFTTPVIVAMLSLSGVLGGALFSNWDKIFGGGHHSAAKTAAAVATEPSSSKPSSSSSMAALQGVWLSPVVQHPYQPDRYFKLRLELNTAGGEMTGRVSDIVEGSGSGSASAPSSDILSPRAVAEGIDFQITARWCCEDGKDRPYETFYQVRPTSQGLAVTRRNNAPGGGKVERFLLSRSD